MIGGIGCRCRVGDGDLERLREDARDDAVELAFELTLELSGELEELLCRLSSAALNAGPSFGVWDA